MAKFHKKNVVIGLSALVLILCFQNCAEMFSDSAEFSSYTVGDVIGSDANCASFEGDEAVYESCLNKTNGLVGQLFYLQDRTDGSVLASHLYSKNGEQISFTSSGLSSVNVILDKGFVAHSYVVMGQVALGQTKFSEGFKISDNQYLTDNSGKKLIEGFALDLRGYLQLPANLSPGQYDIAVLSDDGSILDIDLDNNGVLENVVSNDGYHSIRMACGSKFISLNRNSRYPLRLRYYQGPRTSIALMILLRPVSDKDIPASDESCGKVLADQSLDPLFQRGWLSPEASAYGLPSAEFLQSAL